jgi:galactokinase
MLWNISRELEIDRLALAPCASMQKMPMGVACGLMDQFSSACGVAGALFFDARLDCRPCHFRWVSSSLQTQACVETWRAQVTTERRHLTRLRF